MNLKNDIIIIQLYNRLTFFFLDNIIKIIKHKNLLEVKQIKGLYVGGDGAGLTRGLAQAGACGVYIARNILNKKD